MVPAIDERRCKNRGGDGLRAILRRLERVPPTLLLLLAIVSIQFGSALAITLFPIYGPLGMLFLRQAIGGVALCVLYRSALARAFRQAPLGIVLLGLTMSVQSGVHYEALSRIPLGIAVSIEFLGPLGVALATSRRLVDVLCVLLAAAGILLLTPAIGESLDPVGVLFALGAAAGWACFILASRSVGRALEGGVGLAVAMAVSGLILFPVAGFQAVSDLVANAGTVVAVAAVALLSAALPLLFEFLALRSMPARKYGVLVSVEPVVATVVGAVLLADVIDLRAWIAIVLISLASVGVALLSKPDSR
jgi:inner membrane transporter RhtA